MKVLLKYGVTGIPFEAEETPNLLGVLGTREPPPLNDPGAAIAASLREPIASDPLAGLARGRRNACVVVSDYTRPVPNRTILPPLLRVLEEAGIAPSGITILVATGMHRPVTQEEQKHLLGEGITGTCRVVNHIAARRDEMVEVGRVGADVPALVNRIYVSADLKILTGFIEPHMWAGYSGGRKSILPGITALETLQFVHGPEMIAHPNTEYGRLDGNPFHEAGLEIMKKAGADFIVNVTLNREREVTGVFSGHPVQAHLEGCAFLGRHCLCEVEEPLDFIVTTNAGAPLDCNLYQTVKGITGAAAAVKPGGDIVIASRCNEGAGSEEYRRLLGMVDSPAAFVRRLLEKEFFVPDQWCAQEMYQVLVEKQVWLHTEGLTPDEIERYHLRPVTSLEITLDHLLNRHGWQARWAVVPDGPMVILKLAPGGGGRSTGA